MKFQIILSIPIIVCFSSCLSLETECCDFVGSSPVSKGLYLEKYRTFCAGVFGELTECYLTDSIGFRQKIGVYDEHENFYVNVNGNLIEAYSLQSSSVADTIERRTISRAELLQYHHTDINCLSTTPVFGKNTIKCNDNFYPASSYKTDEGYYFQQVQYKCGKKNYSNAVFYTDSLSFCLFIGVYVPGSFSNNYRVKANSNNTFDFYNIEYKHRVDTVKLQTYSLADFKVGKLIQVCK